MKRIDLYLPILLVVIGTSCADTGTDVAPTCGEDTVEVDNRCTAVLTCGPNTHRSDHTCLSDTDYSCAEDTENVQGVCQADPGPTCGQGTILVENVCVLETRRSCGSGTVDDEGVCVVAEPRSCGSGTRREGDECVPDPHCSEDAVVIDDRCVSLSTLGNTPYTVCTAVARAYCQAIVECCDPYNPWHEDGPFTELLRDPLVCEILVESTCLDRIVPQMVYVAADEAEVVEDPLALLMPFYTIESCAISADVVGAAISGPPEDTLVIEPQMRPGDPCLGNLSCIQPLTCVTNAEGAAVCKEKGAAAHRCDPGDHDDCRDGYYCRYYDDGSNLCAQYLAVGAQDCSTNRPCDPAEAYCNYIDIGGGEMRWVCSARLAEGETCSYDATCQDGLYCRNYFDSSSSTWVSECATYRATDESCSTDEDLRCGPGLVCDTTGTCIDEVDICLFSGGEGF